MHFNNFFIKYMSNLDIKYNNTKIVDGVFLTPLETKNEPTITYTSSNISSHSPDANDSYTMNLMHLITGVSNII